MSGTSRPAYSILSSISTCQKVLEKLINISHPSYCALLSSIISLNLVTHCKKPKSGAASRLYASNSAGLAWKWACHQAQSIQHTRVILQQLCLIPIKPQEIKTRLHEHSSLTLRGICGSPNGLCGSLILPGQCCIETIAEHFIGLVTLEG